MTEPGLDQPTDGRFDGIEHRFPVRIYFEDTDLSGVVYHANYLRYCERARSAMLRLAGIDQRAAIAAGTGTYAVARLSIEYRAPARLDEVLLVVSRLTQVRAASVIIDQRVSRGPVVLAQAAVTAALVGADGKPCRQPREWLAIYRALLGTPE